MGVIVDVELRVPVPLELAPVPKQTYQINGKDEVLVAVHVRRSVYQCGFLGIVFVKIHSADSSNTASRFHCASRSSSGCASNAALASISACLVASMRRVCSDLSGRTVLDVGSTNVSSNAQVLLRFLPRFAQ
jgi:hypothetical protein